MGWEYGSMLQKNSGNSTMEVPTAAQEEALFLY